MWWAPVVDYTAQMVTAWWAWQAAGRPALRAAPGVLRRRGRPRTGAPRAAARPGWRRRGRRPAHLRRALRLRAAGLRRPPPRAGDRRARLRQRRAVRRGADPARATPPRPGRSESPTRTDSCLEACHDRDDRPPHPRPRDPPRARPRPRPEPPRADRPGAADRRGPGAVAPARALVRRAASLRLPLPRQPRRGLADLLDAGQRHRLARPRQLGRSGRGRRGGRDRAQPGHRAAGDRDGGRARARRTPSAATTSTG